MGGIKSGVSCSRSSTVSLPQYDGKLSLLENELAFRCHMNVRSNICLKMTLREYVLLPWSAYST